MKSIKPDFIQNIWGSNCKGALGMIFSPGRNKSSQPHIKRNLQDDLQALKNNYGAQTILSLLEDKQKDLSLQEKICKNLRINLMRYPIPDRSVPTNTNTFKNLVKQIVDNQIRLRQRIVIVHCMAGLGRTGLFAASCVKYIGYNFDQSVSMVRGIRPHTIQMEEQMQFLRNLTF